MMFRRDASAHSGQSLVELIIGIAIAAIIAGSVVGAVVLSVRINKQSIASTNAASLGQELVDKVRSVSEGRWTELYGLSDKSSSSTYYINSTDALFSEDWNSGSDWDISKWTDDDINGGLHDIQSFEGHLQTAVTDDSGARTRAIGSAHTDAELLVKWRKDAVNPVFNWGLRFWLRASNDWPSPECTPDPQPDQEPCEGYVVLMQGGDVELWKYTNSSQIKLGDINYADNTSWHWLRFRVEGDQLKVRVWADGTSEPGVWDMEATDSSLTGGVLQINAWSKVATVYNWYIDDLVLSNTSILSADSLVITEGKEGVLGNDVTSGLIGYWKFDEATGTTAYDSSTNGNYGTLTNNPARNANCKVSSCVEFDGSYSSGAYVDAGDDAIFEVTDEFTVAAWVYAESAPGAQGRTVVSKWDFNSNNELGWNFGAPWDADKFLFSIGNGDPDVIAAGDPDFFVAELNKWTHVVGVYEEGESVLLYVDGVEIGRSALPASNIVYSALRDPLTIGRRSVDPVSEFDGFIDEVRIYNRVLSEDEVERLYSARVYTRWFSVENVNRDSSGNIVDTGGTEDPSTQKITTYVQWNVGGDTANVSLVEFFTRSTRNTATVFTDWDGISGAEGAITDPTSNFSTSTSGIDFSVPGEIFLTTASTSTISWYDSAWKKRRKISVDSTKVPSILTDFPMLINSTEALWAGDQADGGGFLFTSSNGTTKIDHEIERYNQATGELIAWVEIPTLASSTGTDIYIYYKNTTGGLDEQNVTGTWSNGFVGVWHLNESCDDGDTGCIKDSLGNNNATAKNFSGGGGTTNYPNGKIAGADDFDGVDSYHVFPSDASRSVGTDYSVSAWVEFGDVGGTGNWFVFGSRYDTDLALKLGDSGYWGVLYKANSGDWDKYAIHESGGQTGSWEYVVFTANGLTGKLYRSAVEQTLTQNVTATSTVTTSGQNTGFIGIQRDWWGVANVWDGKLDEVRLSDATRSQDWITTEFNSQNSPSTFYTAGAQEDSP